MQLESLQNLWRRAIGPFKEFGAFAGALYAANQVLRRLS